MKALARDEKFSFELLIQGLVFAKDLSGRESLTKDREGGQQRLLFRFHRVGLCSYTRVLLYR